MLNGVLEISTMTLLPHDLDYGFRWQLPYDYNPIATCNPIVEWLGFTQNDDYDRVQLLRAYLRANLTGQSGLQRFVEVVSTAGGSGKSTYCNLAIALVGVENVHITDSHRLEQSRFETACFRHKKLIYFADSGRYSGDKAIDILKRVTGGDTLPYERKNKDAREPFVCKAMVLIAANQPLNTSDPAIPRRRITVPFLRAVHNRDQRVLLEIDSDTKTASGEFAEHLPGLFNWVMAMPESEMRRYLKDTDRAVPSLTEVKSETLIATNTMAAWFDHCCLFADGVKTHIGNLSKTRISYGGEGHSESREKIDDTDEYLYPSYVNYCLQSNHKYESITHFSEKLANLCATILERPNVVKKRDSKGVCIIGITLRRGNLSHPRPISGPIDEESPSTPEQVWASVPTDERVEVTAIVESAWDIVKFDDTDAMDLTKSWMANHSRSVRSHSVRYLESHHETGSAIIKRITKFAPEFANAA